MPNKPENSQQNPQPQNPPPQSLTIKAVDVLASATAQIADAVGTVADAGGVAVHPAIGKVGTAAQVIAESIKDPHGFPVAKAVCNTLGVLAQGAVVAPLTGQAMLQGAKSMPFKHPAAQAAGALGGAALAGPSINKIAEPFGEAVKQGCHSLFDWAGKKLYPPGSSSEAKAEQKTKERPPAKLEQQQAAEKKLTESRTLNQALNGVPLINHQAPMPLAAPVASVYKPSFYQDWNRPRSSYLPYNPSHEYFQAKLQLYSYNLSFTDMMCAERRLNTYLNYHLSAGHSSLGGLSGFSSTLSSTGLGSIYNSIHPYSLVRDCLSGLNQIGGVATKVAVIENLVNSEAHAKAKEYFICFPEKGFPFPLKLVKLLAHELAKGYALYKIQPFFSLHFNKDGFLYPVLHPYYQNTLLGLIIALLDYWMKAYLNGGYFNQEFLERWASIENENCDEAFLRQHLLDLKEYCKTLEKEGGVKFGYESLREIESRSGALRAEDKDSVMKDMQISFRIIGKQGPRLGLAGNIILGDPDFDVEYDIKITPEVEAYLEEYHREHGSYPEAYKKAKEGYIQFAETIKKNMPNLPFCRDFIQLFGVATTLSYAIVSLDEMGLKPVIAESLEVGESYKVPKSFPPLPVRYFKTYPLKFSLSSFLSTLTSEELTSFNLNILKTFSTDEIPALSQFDEALMHLLKKKIHEVIEKTLGPELSQNQAFECNEDELEKIAGKLKESISANQGYLKFAYDEEAVEMLRPLGVQESLKKLSLPEKLKFTLKALEEHFPQLKATWEKKKEFTDAELLKAFPKDWWPEVKRIFQAEEKRLKTSKERAILFCKEAFGLCSVEEKAEISRILSSPSYGYGLALLSVLKPGEAANEGVAYLQASAENLKYQVIHKGELKTHTLTWNELPPNFPRKDELMVELKEEEGLALFKAIEKKGHLWSNEETQRQSFKEGLADTLAVVEGRFTQAYTLSAGKRPANSLKGCIYVESQAEGLSYEVLGFHGKVQKALIPWAELPPGFPRDAQVIVNLKRYAVAIPHLPDENYQALFAWLGEKGHGCITAFQAPHEDKERFTSLKTAVESIINTPPPAGMYRTAESTANLQASLTSINEALTECQTQIDNLAKDKAEALKETREKRYASILEGIDESTLALIKLGRKSQALGLLDYVQEANLKNLKTYGEFIESFSTYILAQPKLASTILSQEYTHSFLTFTGHGLDEKLGESFKIVGGCGMDLPPLYAREVEYADLFSQALAQAFLGTQEDLVSFSFNGKNYLSLSLPVEEIDVLDEDEMVPVLEPKDTLKLAQSAFIDLALLHQELKDLPLNLLKESLDSSGAGFMHYACAFLELEVVKELSERLGEAVFASQDVAGNTPLHFAAQEGKLETARWILEAHPKLVDIQNAQGITPLIFAVQKGHLELAKLFIAFKANPNHKLSNGLFPLYLALQAGQEAIASWLIENIYDLNLSESLDSKMTALHLALELGLVEIAKLLIEEDASLEIRRKKDAFSPLDLAITKGLIDLVKLMQTQGASLKTLSPYGRSLLHLAAERGQCACIEFLLTQGLDPKVVDAYGESALMMAIKSSQLETARLLAAHAPKEQLNQKNKKGETASLLALLYGMPELGDFLIERGEDPNLLDLKGQNYVYHLVCRGESQRLEALIDKGVIDYKLSFEMQGGKRKNLLELAVEFRQVPIVYHLTNSSDLSMDDKDPKNAAFLLLKFAAITDEVGYLRRKARTLLGLALAPVCSNTRSFGLFERQQVEKVKELTLIAAQNGAFRCLEWLLEHQGMIEREDYQRWFKAALTEGNKIEAVNLLVYNVNIDVDAPMDSKGNSALHLATRQGFIQAVESLLNAGALPDLRNQENHTPFHIALRQKNHRLLKRLFKRTPIAEWPRDLWQTPVSQPTKAILNLLERHRQRLKERVVLDLSSPFEKKELLPSLLMDEKELLSLMILNFKIRHGQFRDLAELLREHPELISLFRSEQGADLVKQAFFALKLPQAAGKRGVEEGARDFFALLKSHGLDILAYKGAHNPLWSLLEFELSEEDLDYRLSFFRTYFPGSLAILAVDEIQTGRLFIEVALRLNKLKLFKALAEVSAQSSKQGLIPFYPLHEAVRADQYELVKDLLNTYEINEANDQGQTPLFFAAEKNNLTLINFLLSRGANPDRVDLLGRNLLYLAFMNRAEASILHLLPLLKDKNQADHQGETPLIWAASCGALSVIRFFCGQGDYTESYDHQGWNALHHASVHGQTAAIELLIEKGFDINSREKPKSAKKEKKALMRTPFHLAALTAQVAAAKKLIELGADLRLEDKAGEGFFEYGLKSKSSEFLSLMQGENLSPFYLARVKQALVNIACANHEEALCEFISKGVNLAVSDASGATLLHLAAANNAGKALALLLKGKDLVLDVEDFSGMTPLHYAAFLGHVRPLKLLCQAKAKLDYASSRVPTPLFYAAEQGKRGAIEVLLCHGANYSLKNAEGFTPAQIALLKGHMKIVQRLREAGDKSLEAEALRGFPQEIKEKLEKGLAVFLSSEEAKPVLSLGGALVRHGFYRQCLPERSEGINEALPLARV